MRPEVQVLPGPPLAPARGEPVAYRAGMRFPTKSVRARPIVLAAVTAAALATTLRRRQAASDADSLWREATSDASR